MTGIVCASETAEREAISKLDILEDTQDFVHNVEKRNANINDEDEYEDNWNGDDNDRNGQSTWASYSRWRLPYNYPFYHRFGSNRFDRYRPDFYNRRGYYPGLGRGFMNDEFYRKFGHLSQSEISRRFGHLSSSQFFARHGFYPPY